MRRNTKARTISLMALFSAMAVVILYIASVIPTGALGFSALTGIVVLAAVIEGKIAGGLAVFAVSALLSFLLSADKTSALLYMIFFGYYPVLKSLIERLRKLVPEWILKILLVNIVITVIIFLLSGFITIDFGYDFLNSTAVVYVLANIAFVIYDLALSKLAGIYLARIYKKK